MRHDGLRMSSGLGTSLVLHAVVPALLWCAHLVVPHAGARSAPRIVQVPRSEPVALALVELPPGLDLARPPGPPQMAMSPPTRATAPAQARRAEASSRPDRTLVAPSRQNEAVPHPARPARIEATKAVRAEAPAHDAIEPVTPLFSGEAKAGRTSASPSQSVTPLGPQAQEKVPPLANASARPWRRAPDGVPPVAPALPPPPVTALAQRPESAVPSPSTEAARSPSPEGALAATMVGDRARSSGGGLSGGDVDELVRERVEQVAALFLGAEKLRRSHAEEADLRFELDENGYVQGFQLLRSSHVVEIDRALEMVLHLAEPFPVQHRSIMLRLPLGALPKPR